MRLIKVPFMEGQKTKRRDILKKKDNVKIFFFLLLIDTILAQARQSITALVVTVIYYIHSTPTLDLEYQITGDIKSPWQWISICWGKGTASKYALKNWPTKTTRHALQHHLVEIFCNYYCHLLRHEINGANKIAVPVSWRFDTARYHIAKQSWSRWVRSLYLGLYPNTFDVQ